MAQGLFFILSGRPAYSGSPRKNASAWRLATNRAGEAIACGVDQVRKSTLEALASAASIS
jgi:hypothetical protein